MWPSYLPTRKPRLPPDALKMATSLGSNTYNRQNWEDAVSVPARRGREGAASPGPPAGPAWLRRRRGSSGEEPAPRPSRAGAGAGAGGRRAALLRAGREGAQPGPGTSPLCTPASSSPRCSPPAAAGRADGAPSRDRARAGPRAPALRFPALAPRPSPTPGSPLPAAVAAMAGSSEPGPHPDLPLSPGLPHPVPDVSWRKPVHPNGE